MKRILPADHVARLNAFGEALYTHTDWSTRFAKASGRPRMAALRWRNGTTSPPDDLDVLLKAVDAKRPRMTLAIDIYA